MCAFFDYNYKLHILVILVVLILIKLICMAINIKLLVYVSASYVINSYIDIVRVVCAA